MKKLVVAFAAGFLLVTTSPPTLGQGTFPLEYQIIKDFTYRDPLVSMSTQYIGRSPGMPAGVKGTPKEAQGPLAYYATPFGSLQLVIAMDTADPPNLFVDRNGDGNLADEKPVKRVKSAESNQASQYGPITVKLGRDGETARILILRYGMDEYLRICPAGYLSAQVKLDGKSYKVALIDTDFNGRLEATKGLGEVYSHQEDMLGIDLNGDGRFVYDRDSQSEIQPLTPMVHVAGSYYDVKLTADGASIVFDKVEPKMGTLEIKGENCEVMLLGESGMHYLTGPETSWQLPAGRYVCQSAGLAKMDADKNKWVLRTSGQMGKLAALEIKPGATKTVELGGPFTVKADVRKQSSGWIFKGTEIAVSFVIVGKGGEEYSPAAEKNGTQVPAPKITIYDKDGKVLAAGNFAYG